MIFRLRRKHPITAIAPNRVWTTLSVFVGLTCGTAAAQIFPVPDPPQASAVPQRSAYRPSSAPKSLLYRADISRIKVASLESDPVLFDRIHREQKLESIRLLLSQSQDNLRILRRRIIPWATGSFEEDLNAEMARAVRDIDGAESHCDAAIRRLETYHAQSSQESTAIFGRRLPAWQLYISILERVRSCEVSLSNFSDGIYRALQQVDGAQQLLTTEVEGWQDASSLPKIKEALATLEATNSLLDQLNTTSANAAAVLKQMRKDQLPDCSYGKNCENASLKLLNASKPALKLLKDTAVRIDEMQNRINDLETLEKQAIRLAEEADSIAQPSHKDVRALQWQAEKVIEEVKDELNNIVSLLNSDGDAKSVVCTRCGQRFGETRAVGDPICNCANTNEPMEKVERKIKEIIAITGQIDQAIKKMDDVAIQVFESDTIVLRLGQAMEQAQQFQNNDFDFYPVGVYTDELPASAKRAFSPIIATYVARQTSYASGYFDDVNLERYGNTTGLIQPVVSYGRFIKQLATLPYHMKVTPPYQRQYTLGYHRPGDCVPFIVHMPCFNTHAAMAQGVVTALFFLLP